LASHFGVSEDFMRKRIAEVYDLPYNF